MQREISFFDLFLWIFWNVALVADFMFFPSWKWRNEDFVPESTLRILHYDGALPSNPVKLLEQIWPAHTDSSLITIAPRSTLPALEMKRFDTGEWVCPEDFMGEEHMAVFMGDSGACTCCYLFLVCLLLLLLFSSHSPSQI